MYHNDPERIYIGDKEHYFNNLTEVQNEALDYIVNSKTPARVINVSSTGTGKTHMTIMYIQHVFPLLQNKHITIFCPKATEKQWLSEVEKTGLSCQIIKDSKHISDLGKCDVSILTPQLAAYVFNKMRSFRPELTANTGLLIYDEVHSASTKTISKKVLDYMKFVEGIYVLSATPEWNSPKNIYAMVHTIYPLMSIPDWKMFMDKYCAIEYFVRAYVPLDKNKYETFFSKYGKQKLVRIPTVSGWKHKDSMYEFLEMFPCVVRVENKLLKEYKKDIEVELSEEQSRMYKTLTKDDYMNTSTGDYTVDYPITKRIRLRQVCLATPKAFGARTVEFDESKPSAKIEKIKEAHLSLNRRAIVWTNSAQFAAMLERAMPNDLKRYTGDMSQKKRDEVVQWFKDTPNGFICIVCAAGGVGLDGLQKVCNTQIWADRCEPLGGAQEIQCLGRLNRTSTNFDCVISFNLVAKGTLEDVKARTILH